MTKTETKLRQLRREVARHQTKANGDPRCQCDGPRACLDEILYTYSMLFSPRPKK